MLASKQVERMLGKLRRFEEILDPMLFRKIAKIDSVKYYLTRDRLYEIPGDSVYTDIESGSTWGEEEAFAWFKTEFVVPQELDGKDVFIMPHTQGYETLLWVNGKPFGTFATKIVFTRHGNHYCDLLKKNVKAGEVIDIALEVYTGHSYMGCAPLEPMQLKDYTYHFDGIDICLKDEQIQDFYFDLKVINELVGTLPETSFRKGDLINTLYEVHKRLYYAYEDTDEETFRAALESAAPFLKEALAVKNGPEAPEVGIIGHSHIDTAWLWKSTETIKKCARTFSNQISLMQQYPEYKFMQSAACHSDMILKYYPELFEDIKTQVAAGRYEPNGAVWIECDCNITSGESIIRQFLWGQRFTRKHFGYTSDCFWLPDTFGYSAAIPQIMKGCRVNYFLTTKIDWNDTNRFPYESFYWQGLDGTTVFTHFNKIDCWPSPKYINDTVTGDANEYKTLQERSVSRKRLLSYGFGDGGGGPQYEMAETARRIEDLNGCAKTKFTTVSDFMTDLEASAKNASTYKGELYLEIHRGTLTNQHNIKRNNRKAEIALRNLEFLTVSNAVKNGEAAKDTEIHPLYETLLMNQFHDILPGTCIPSAHKLALEQTGALIEKASALISKEVGGSGDFVTVTNTLSFDRNDVIFLECGEGLVADIDCSQQTYKNLDGKNILMLGGITVPAFSTVKFKLIPGTAASVSPVSVFDNSIETPFAKIKFDGKGYIESFFDKRANREIRGEGYPLNTFIIAEDLPTNWDNWDIDADIECKFEDCSTLLSQEVVSVGAVAAVIRSKYAVSKKSTVTQDAFYFADSAEIRFDTVMDWQDNHRFLKAAFDTNIQSDFARFEIQYGNIIRPTTRNNAVEKAKFEVVNHKFTDLSETRYGVAILNDSKYGISAEGGNLRLSLHKGGTRPDFEGDRGVHKTTYSFLPHLGGFTTETVVKPAYELNMPSVVGCGDFESVPLIVPKAENVIVESIKPCEDNEKAFIARLYETEGTFTNCPLEIFGGAKKAEITDMLEEVQGTLETSELKFHPFEIKTLKISY